MTIQLFFIEILVPSLVQFSSPICQFFLKNGEFLFNSTRIPLVKLERKPLLNFENGFPYLKCIIIIIYNRVKFMNRNNLQIFI